jgi:hypothetical protein
MPIITGDKTGKLKKNEKIIMKKIMDVIWLQRRTFKTFVFLTAFATKKSAVPQQTIAMIPKIMPNETSMVIYLNGLFKSVLWTKPGETRFIFLRPGINKLIE